MFSSSTFEVDTSFEEEGSGVGWIGGSFLDSGGGSGAGLSGGGEGGAGTVGPGETGGGTVVCRGVLQEKTKSRLQASRKVPRFIVESVLSIPRFVNSIGKKIYCPREKTALV